MHNDLTRARKTYLDAKAARYRGGPIISVAMQEALSQYLIAYARPPDPGSSRPSFDPEIAYDIGEALRDVTRGHRPPLLSPIRKRGAPPATFAIEDAQRDAVRYVLFCRAKLLSDPAPYKTVCQQYPVPPRTVQGWVRKRSAEIEVPGNPTRLNASRHKLRIVKAAMELSGRLYSDLPGARNHKAIRDRAKTKKPQN